LKKTLFTVVLALVINTSFAQFTVYTVPQTEVLHSIYSFTSLVNIVGGDNGIFRTPDAGKTWETVYRRETLEIYDVKFIGQTGYAGGYIDTLNNYKAIILKSTDAGTTWKTCYENFGAGGISCIVMININEVYACGTFNTTSPIIKTTNGGIGWLPYLITSTNSMVPWMTLHNDILYAVTHPGQPLTVIRNFHGNQWDTVVTGLEFSCSRIYSNAGKLYIVGLEGHQFRPILAISNNNGTSWAITTFPVLGWLYSLDFSDNETFYVAGRIQNSISVGPVDGVVYKTTDSGNSWSMFYRFPGEYFLDIKITDNYIFMAGVGGSFVRFDPSVIGIQGSPFLLEGYSLKQNYPNPFNPTTIIKYSVPEKSFVTIKIYDVMGREIQTLINEYKETGTYEVIFIGNTLPTGVYFYTLQSGNFTETKKMILLK